jgi:signal transduction histidine kinase
MRCKVRPNNRMNPTGLSRRRNEGSAVKRSAFQRMPWGTAARRVVLRLDWEDSHLALIIQDDGRGFSVPATLRDLTTQGHFGLAGIQERVELIGGVLTLESAPGEGATVRVVKQVTDRQA